MDPTSSSLSRIECYLASKFNVYGYLLDLYEQWLELNNLSGMTGGLFFTLLLNMCATWQ